MCMCVCLYVCIAFCQVFSPVKIELLVNFVYGGAIVLFLSILHCHGSFLFCWFLFFSVSLHFFAMRMFMFNLISSFVHIHGKVLFTFLWLWWAHANWKLRGKKEKRSYIVYCGHGHEYVLVRVIKQNKKLRLNSLKNFCENWPTIIIFIGLLLFATTWFVVFLHSFLSLSLCSVHWMNAYFTLVCVYIYICVYLHCVR